MVGLSTCPCQKTYLYYKKFQSEFGNKVVVYPSLRSDRDLMRFYPRNLHRYKMGKEGWAVEMDSSDEDYFCEEDYGASLIVMGPARNVYA